MLVAMAVTALALVGGPEGSGVATSTATAMAASGTGAPPEEVAGRSFTARITVDWVDHRGRHNTTLEVRAAGGLVQVDGVRPAGGGPLVLGDGWLMVARPGEGFAVAAATERKYDVVREPGPQIAGRATGLVTLRSNEVVRERLAVDDDTGLVLRRELFGSDGRAVRVVTVTQLDTSPSPQAVGSGASRPAPDKATRLRPEALEAPYAAPATLAGGYERVAAFRRGRVVHLLYSDGLHGLSVFMQPGRLDDDRLPEGGRPVRVGGADARRFTWAGGEIVTWESGPVVRTVVGDAAPDEVMAAARSLPPAPGMSVLGRIRRASRHVAEVLSGGR